MFYLLYFILINKNIDVARVIAQEIIITAEISNGDRKLMAYPRLIMGLCKNKGVMIPDEGLKLNIGLVDDEYDEI